MSINGDCPFCLNAEEAIVHIFNTCDLATNIWFIIDNNCPNPLYTNLGIMDWLEYLYYISPGLRKTSIVFWRSYYHPLGYMDP